MSTERLGATKDQVNEMMRNLLEERFQFAFHTAWQVFDAYNLKVAKGGPKLKEAAPADGPLPPLPTPGSRPPAPDLDQDGFPILPAGRSASQSSTRDRVTRVKFRMSTPAQLLDVLTFTLRGARTFDNTRLTGPFDFRLELAAGPVGELSDAGLDLETALERQLGLKLEKTTVPLDVLVVDRIYRKPTAD